MRPVSFLLAPLVGMLAGCGYSEAAFIDDFVTADCTYLLECTSEPVLSFLGWETLEDCMDDRGPEEATRAASCIYERKAAKACVEAVEAQGCAADGEEREYPAICNDAFILCSGDDTDTDADTDPGTEASTL